MFKISVLFGDSPIMIPAEIAPGFEQSEIPAELLINPLMTDHDWVDRKKEILSWGMPKIKVSSHWFSHPCNTPDADWDAIEFWSKRMLKRLGDLGVETAGIYGLFFKKPESASDTKAIDKALRYANLLGDEAAKNKMQIALEPMANPTTLFPTYAEGLKFAKELKHPAVKVMADLNYFLKNKEPFDVIKQDPSFNLHCHVAGNAPDGAQPNVGGIRDIHKAFFKVLVETKFEGGVSCACPWINTGTGPFSLKEETAKTLKYMQDLRAEVYAEKK
jgi:sugar phosphate isomerase/epimerase